VGDNTTKPFRGRLICATNRNMEDMVEEGSFRKDLYYRLNVLPLKMPPLRDRAEDIPLLAEHFLKTGSYSDRNLSEDAMEVLKCYSWPGNVRELQNIIERICVMCSSPVIKAEDLPSFITSSFREEPAKLRDTIPTHTREEPAALPTLAEIEKAWTFYVLEKKTGGEKRAAARLLGINETTLHRRLEKYKAEDEG